MIGKIKIILFGSLLFVNSAFSQSLDLSSLEDDADAATATIFEDVPGIENKCQDHVDERENMKLGQNVKPNGSRFFVAVGDSMIKAPPGHPNYMNSRQNAYTAALMNAKKNILEALKTTVSRDIKLSLAEGKFVEDDKVKEEIQKEVSSAQSSDNRDMKSAYNKTLELLNRKLDSELKKSDPNPAPPPKTVEEAEEQMTEKIEAVLGESFNDVIESHSAQNLYGIKRIFTYESVPPGKPGSICVVALYSSRTKAIADGILQQDTSLFPTGKPNPNYKKLIPNPKTNNGKSELFSTFGIDMIRDEQGNFVLISYAQAGVTAPVVNKTSINAALRRAVGTAKGQLATYLKEAAALKSKQQNTESYKQMADGTEYYEGSAALKEDMESQSKNVDITGAQRGKNWALKHPITKQTVVGTWLLISSATMEGSKADIKDFDNRPKKGTRATGSSKSSNKANYGKTTKGYSGGSRKSSDDDF